MADIGGQPLYHAILSDSGRAQKPALLFKPGSFDSVNLAPHSEVVTLVDSWLADVDGDEMLEEYSHTRTPLAVNGVVSGHGVQFIVLHTKSAYVNQGAALWNNLATRQQYVHEALHARRRNAAEAMRVRKHLDEVLAASPSARLVVFGDLNDGPGMDYFEENYLAQNLTDILVGSTFDPENIFFHAQHDVAKADRYTAVFDDFVTGEQNKKLLLDHVLLSPGFSSAAGLRSLAGSGTVHHGDYDANVINGGRYRDERPSDHRPVSVSVQY